MGIASLQETVTWLWFVTFDLKTASYTTNDVTRLCLYSELSVTFRFIFDYKPGQQDVRTDETIALTYVYQQWRSWAWHLPGAQNPAQQSFKFYLYVCCCCCCYCRPTMTTTTTTTAFIIIMIVIIIRPHRSISRMRPIVTDRVVLCPSVCLSVCRQSVCLRT